MFKKALLGALVIGSLAACSTDNIPGSTIQPPLVVNLPTNVTGFGTQTKFTENNSVVVQPNSQGTIQISFQGDENQQGTDYWASQSYSTYGLAVPNDANSNSQVLFNPAFVTYQTASDDMPVFNEKKGESTVINYLGNAFVAFNGKVSTKNQIKFSIDFKNPASSSGSLAVIKNPKTGTEIYSFGGFSNINKDDLSKGLNATISSADGTHKGNLAIKFYGSKVQEVAGSFEIPNDIKGVYGAKSIGHPFPTNQTTATSATINTP